MGHANRYLLKQLRAFNLETSYDSTGEVVKLQPADDDTPPK